MVLEPIAAVPTDWASPLAAFTDTLAHEEKVTALINNLYSLALDEKDHATCGKLDWFVAEQVEEEETARGLIDRLKLIGDNGLALYMLDQELAARVYNVPAPPPPNNRRRPQALTAPAAHAQGRILSRSFWGCRLGRKISHRGTEVTGPALDCGRAVGAQYIAPASLM